MIVVEQNWGFDEIQPNATLSPISSSMSADRERAKFYRFHQSN